MNSIEIWWSNANQVLILRHVMNEIGYWMGWHKNSIHLHISVLCLTERENHDNCLQYIWHGYCIEGLSKLWSTLKFNEFSSFWWRLFGIVDVNTSIWLVFHIGEYHLPRRTCSVWSCTFATFFGSFYFMSLILCVQEKNPSQRFMALANNLLIAFFILWSKFPSLCCRV